MVLVEVLSESTADRDRGVHFGHYRRVPKHEYVIIARDARSVEHHVCVDDGQWTCGLQRGRGAFASRRVDERARNGDLKRA